MRLLLMMLALAAVQAPPPSSEIFLASLSMADGAVRLGEPVNISKSPGYDNQPFFTPDGTAILFTSDRSRVVSVPVAGVKPPASQMDTFRYDIASKAVRQVTDTPESEYSPTVTPDGKGISVIRVEGDGTQRLWRFTLDGRSPSLILPDVEPVGYHAWIDEHRLALFILGERGQPATLQVADSRTGKAELIATDVGRSIRRMPSGRISFVQREGGDRDSPARLTIRQFDPDATGDERVTTLVPAVPGSTQPDLAWAPNGTLLAAHGDTLYRWRQGDAAWSVAADLAALGLRGATRLAVSPGGDFMAIVADGR